MGTTRLVRPARHSYFGLGGAAALATLFFPLAGCQKVSGTEALLPTQNRATIPVNPARTGTNKLVGKSTIATSPAYRSAVAAYARKDYQSALSQLKVLSTSKGDAALTAVDDAFLQRQIALCERAITGKPAHQATATAAEKPARKTRKADNADCGPRALLLVAKQVQPGRSLPTLASLRTVAGTTPAGTSLEGMARAAKAVGLQAQGVQMDKDALSRLSTPALAFVDGNHFIAVLSVHDRRHSIVGGEDTATIYDPNGPGKEDVSLARLLSRSGGILLRLTSLEPDKQTAESTSKTSGT